MLRNAPGLWRQKGIIPTLLTPLSWFYYIGHKIKWSLSKPYKSSIPVICVGGIVAGGSGKTPTLHTLLKIIKDNDLYKKPVVLLRGYGGNIIGPAVVDPQKHTYHDVGDEALLHAALATTIVGADRAAGAKMAEQIGADVILMDDGLQNNTLLKDTSILVINGQQALGNGKLIPAGPLREPLKDALARVSAVVMIGEGVAIEHSPIIKASISVQSILDSSRTYSAFAGIGDPYKFKRTLTDLGLNLKNFTPFPDHYPYSQDNIFALKLLADGTTLITTAKDYVRIPVAVRDGIEILPVELQFESPEEIIQIVKGLR